MMTIIGWQNQSYRTNKNVTIKNLTFTIDMVIL